MDKASGLKEKTGVMECWPLAERGNVKAKKIPKNPTNSRTQLKVSQTKFARLLSCWFLMSLTSAMVLQTML